MLRTYTISREGLRGLLWRSARLSFAVTVLLIAIALRMPLVDDEARHTTGWILGYMFLVLVLCTWLATRSTRRTWKSFRIEMTPESLRRVQNRLPDISIERSEVVNVEEMAGRGMVVRTADSEKFIFVPTAIEDYKEVREELGTWAPLVRLSAGTTWRRQWMGVTAAMLMVGWMVATMVSRSVVFVVPSAFGICVFLLWAFMAAQRSLHLAPGAKKGMWLVLFPILGLTLKTTYMLASLSRLR